jgi:hypothetical protein
MTEPALQAIQRIIQEDPQGRGLAAQSEENLVTATAGDFAAACLSLADSSRPAVGIVTGFLIPQANPPAAETDGPLGALFLAHVLSGLGARVVIAADGNCQKALAAGCRQAGLDGQVKIIVLPPASACDPARRPEYSAIFYDRAGPLTHLLALERVGPNHTLDSIGRQAGISQAVIKSFQDEIPDASRDRCYTAGGRDITALTSAAHWLFDEKAHGRSDIVTIGIGDGGNEIGMGKIRWDIIQRNIHDGGRIACRIATDYLIVSGVSNWGAYGLAAGILFLRETCNWRDRFNPDREREILDCMVEEGGLVDGITGQRTATVDGLEFADYAQPLGRLQEILGRR